MSDKTFLGWSLSKENEPDSPSHHQQQAKQTKAPKELGPQLQMSVEVSKTKVQERVLERSPACEGQLAAARPLPDSIHPTLESRRWFLMLVCRRWKRTYGASFMTSCTHGGPRPLASCSSPSPFSSPPKGYPGATLVVLPGPLAKAR